MNKVFLIGRLTREPEIRYNFQNVAITRFALAVNRPKRKDKERETDFINCVCFNNQAVNLVKYQKKGNLLAILGRIRTGSFNDEKSGKKVYTTEVVCDEIQYLTFKDNVISNSQESIQTTNQQDNELEKYKQLSTKTIMDTDYNPELQITDDDVPF